MNEHILWMFSVINITARKEEVGQSTVKSKVHMEEVRDGWLNQANVGTCLQETTVCVHCERETQG